MPTKILYDNPDPKARKEIVLDDGETRIISVTKGKQATSREIGVADAGAVSYVLYHHEDVIVAPQGDVEQATDRGMLTIHERGAATMIIPPKKVGLTFDQIYDTIIVS